VFSCLGEGEQFLEENGMMESKRTLLVVIALCLILGRAQEQQALGGPLYLSYEGNLTSVDDPFGRFDASVYVGAEFSGNYSYDPDGAIDSVPGDPTVGAYDLDGELVAHVGDMYFAATDVFAPVYNDYVAGSDIVDQFAITAQTLTSGNLPLKWMKISITDRTGTAFSSDALPTTLDLSDFPELKAFEIYADEYDTQLFGHLTSLTLVPEPATLTLLVLGGLAVLRRRTGTRLDG